MKPDLQEPTYWVLTDALLSRCHNPAEIVEVLTNLRSLDYLDWEELIEQRKTENRVYRVFIPCSECHIVSNREAWIPVKRKTNGIDFICYDCTRQLRSQHTYRCAWCEEEYLSLRPQRDGMDVCTKHDEYLTFVQKHLRRAEATQTLATLTVRQWRVTINHFGDICAYCGHVPSVGMEHYLPLSLGGGTTANNCLPSCARCNNRKIDKHPDEFACLFPAENMRRIREYLKV